jgi:hypothetical protein
MARGKKTGGRAAGTPNKTTKSAKEAILWVFHALGDTPAMERWARDNPTEYYRIFSRLLPHEVTGADGQNLIPPTVHITLQAGP